MRCNQCEALMINGIYCHEIGCPNKGARVIDGEWVKYFQCRECGCDARADTGCDCQTPICDEFDYPEHDSMFSNRE